ncbi:hypothetical protein LUZ63_000371 [Rhynchospora breviuscula]|uniref:Aminotransferase-like plant mobile domain-containing protein n=1 Tax=Rhynchospora breviuscula TaxID=2022672 RepID=A0A9Q0CUX0_9POAL|nr:hypothetical protein LUZ63_000371 [Rhynchospora breviuscula]
MPPRKRVPEAPPRRSTRLRRDPGASTSTASVDAEASTSADPIVPPGPVNADRLLHLDESKVRGTGHWRTVLRRAKMSRTAEVDERLMRLGLIHFVQLGHMQLDHSLLQGLAMFWRPETHTFFFPHVGEMTVTLEDVAFLYGLPTAGRTVTRRTDYDAIQLLQNLALPEDTDTAIVEKCFREKERKKWTTRHKSKKFTGPTRSGIEYARDVCMKMKPEHVVWRPYDHIRDRMSRCAQVEQRMFLLRIPCIHYWVVMWHHVDRVMHQFMLYQTVPPPPPEPWSRMEELMGYQHNTYRGIDWHQLFVHEVNPVSLWFRADGHIPVFLSLTPDPQDLIPSLRPQSRRPHPIRSPGAHSRSLRPTQYGGGYSQPFVPTPAPISQADAYYQAYGTPLQDPFTPISHHPFGDSGASSSRPPRHSTPFSTTYPPPPPPPGLAPGREPRNLPGATWDLSHSQGWFRRDGHQ